MKKNLLILLMSIFYNYTNGQQTFSKVYYETNLDTYGYAIAPSSDNGFLICGSKFTDGLIYKIDSAGAILWDKKYTIGGRSEFTMINPVGDSNYVVVGNAYTATTTSLICMKINATGDTIWSRNIGGTNFKSATSVQPTSDGGFILSGLASYSTAPYYKSLLIKLDSSGNMEWNSLVTTGSHSNYIFSIKQTPDSGYVAIGESDSLNHVGLVLFKLNSGGAFLWGKKYVNAPYALLGMDVDVLTDGFACLTNNGSDYAFMKTDTSGTILWTQSYPLPGFGGGCQICNQSRLKPTSDGGYAFVKGLDPVSGSQNSIVRIDSIGNVKWYQDIQMSPTDIVETSDSGFMVVGNGPLYGVRGMSFVTNPQIGIVHTDSLGNSSCTFYITLIPTTDSFTVYPLTYSIGPVGIVTPVQPVISLDVLTPDTGCVPLIGGFGELSPDNFISIYPNPASSRINFSIKKSSRQYNLSIRNVLDQEVYSKLLTGNETRSFSMDADFNPGMYIVVLSDGRFVYSKKLVIE